MSTKRMQQRSKLQELDSKQSETQDMETTEVQL